MRFDADAPERRSSDWNYVDPQPSFNGCFGDPIGFIEIDEPIVHFAVDKDQLIVVQPQENARGSNRRPLIPIDKWMILQEAFA